MPMFTQAEIDALLQEARQEPEGGIGYHAALVRSHLEKFNAAKRQTLKAKHWEKVEIETYRLKKCLGNLQK